MKILPCSNSTKCYGMYMYVYISINRDVLPIWYSTYIDDLPIKQNGDFQWLCYQRVSTSPCRTTKSWSKARPFATCRDLVMEQQQEPRVDSRSNQFRALQQHWIFSGNQTSESLEGPRD